MNTVSYDYSEQKYYRRVNKKITSRAWGRIGSVAIRPGSTILNKNIPRVSFQLNPLIAGL